MRAEIITCAGCGEPLELQEGIKIVHCKYCGNSHVIPKFFSKETEQEYNNAEKALIAGEFDRAFTLFSDIEKEHTNDAHLHWSMALCKYGIQMEEDPLTGRRVPTLNRMQNTSFLNDIDYKLAISNTEDDEVVAVYTELAEKIAEIQREYNNYASTIEPFDIFICYKESDAKGLRTKDSTIAEVLYKRLTDSGYRIFFAKETLSEYIGKQYEAIIFSALNSAKVLISVGTRKEYINAPWVKNEWSRYLNLMKNDSSRLLILAYSGIRPDDFPTELSGYQGFEVSNNDEIEALVKRVNLAIDGKKEQSNQKTSHNEVKNLLMRAEDELKHSHFEEADDFVETALNIDYQNADAHLLKLLIANKVCSIDKLDTVKKPLDNHLSYNNFLANCKDENNKKRVREINGRIHKRIEKERKEREELEKISRAKDAEERARLEEEYRKKEEIYVNACRYYVKPHTRINLVKCRNTARKISGFKSADELAENSSMELHKRNITYIIMFVLTALSTFCVVKGVGVANSLQSIPLFLLSILLISISLGKIVGEITTRILVGFVVSVLGIVAGTSVYIWRTTAMNISVEEDATVINWFGRSDALTSGINIWLTLLAMLIVAILFTVGLRKLFGTDSIIFTIVFFVISGVASFFIVGTVVCLFSYIKAGIDVGISPTIFFRHFIDMIEEFWLS